MKTLGRRIALYRNDNRWTQEKLASEIGIAQGVLSDMENDKISPKWDMINKIAAALGIHVLNLLPIDLNVLYEQFQDDQLYAHSNPQSSGQSLHITQERKLWEALLKAKDETIESLKRQLEYSETASYPLGRMEVWEELQ